MVRISIIISLVLLACFVSGRKIKHLSFLIIYNLFFLLTGSNQEMGERALSDETLLGRVERDAGKRRNGRTSKRGKRKMRGRKRGKNTRGKKGRKAQRQCGRQSGLKY